MSVISFYHLTKTTLEKALPPLLLKVLASGKRAVLLAESDARLRQIDQFLWTFSTNKVIPHGVREDGFSDQQPVYLTLREENPNGAEVLVLTGGKEPEFLKDFPRCVDMFDGASDNEAAAARARWQRYKDGGHTVTYWKQDSQGAWEKTG